MVMGAAGGVIMSWLQPRSAVQLLEPTRDVWVAGQRGGVYTMDLDAVERWLSRR